MRYFFEKKNRQAMGAPPSDPRILPTPIVLLQNILIFSPIKSQL